MVRSAIRIITQLLSYSRVHWHASTTARLLLSFAMEVSGDIAIAFARDLRPVVMTAHILYRFDHWQ